MTSLVIDTIDEAHALMGEYEQSLSGKARERRMPICARRVT